MFGRATIRLGIGPHSSLSLFYVIVFLFLMHDYLCSVSLGLLYILWLFLLVLTFVFSVLAKRLAGKCISEMTYFVKVNVNANRDF